MVTKPTEPTESTKTTKSITYTIDASKGHRGIGSFFVPTFLELHLGVVVDNLEDANRDKICISAFPIFGNEIGCVNCQEKECKARDILLSRRNR